MTNSKRLIILMQRSLTVNSTKFWLTSRFMGLDENV